jgi:uncharacterized protein YjbI with pentapeptide repeats
MNQPSSRRSVLHALLSALTRKAPEQTQEHVQPPRRPAPDDHDAWRAYWKEQGQPWRTEPEIDLKRQEELSKHRAIVPDVEKGIYPFKGMRLSRADVEWLLATHESGRGPVDWSDESQGSRNGLDLRGTDMRHIDLQQLPLTRLRCGLTHDEQLWATEAQCAMARAHMENVFLNGAQLQGANLHNVLLAKSQLVGCQLECADLSFADLQEANLMQGQFKQAHLKGARLQEASLYKAQLEETKLYEAKLNGANLGDVKLSTQSQMGPLLADAQWTEVNLARVDWSQGKILGDEQLARQRKINGTSKTKVQRLSEYESAVRANRQFTVALQTQGLNEYASHFAYRAQVLQRRVFWFQMLQSEAKLRQRGRALGAWLFSWFLFLLAGYGYKPGRSFLAYLLMIGTFMAFYLLLNPHLAWYEAIVVSMTAFHGRGFSPSTFSPGDPLSIASAVEAFVGLIIEVTFIATLTRRFFGQ